MRRSLCVLALTCLAIASSVAGIASDPEGQFSNKINEERSKVGLSALSPDGAILEVARRHSARMADAGRIFHNDNLPNEVEGWVLLGENVGRGGDVQSIHEAFMNSAKHRAQILESRYQGGAVGVVEKDGTIWVTELFIKRDQPSTAAPAATVVNGPSRQSSRRPRLASREAARAVTPPVEATVEAAVFPERHALVGIVLAEETQIGTVPLALPLVSVDLQTSSWPNPLLALATAAFCLALCSQIALRDRQHGRVTK